VGKKRGSVRTERNHCPPTEQSIKRKKKGGGRKIYRADDRQLSRIEGQKEARIKNMRSGCHLAPCSGQRGEGKQEKIKRIWRTGAYRQPWVFKRGSRSESLREPKRGGTSEMGLSSSAQRAGRRRLGKRDVVGRREEYCPASRESSTSRLDTDLGGGGAQRDASVRDGREGYERQNQKRASRVSIRAERSFADNQLDGRS